MIANLLIFVILIVFTAFFVASEFDIQDAEDVTTKGFFCLS